MGVPCESPEAWAGVYLQVVAAVLVFGLGVPALVMQVAVSEDIRRILHARWRLLPFGASLILVAWVSAVFLVWVGPRLTSPHAQLAVTATLMAALLFWLLQTGYRRDRVLRFLAGRCNRHIRRTGTPEDAALLDIAHLGEHGKPGVEKALALEVLAQLARAVQDHRRYAGNALDRLLQATTATLREGGSSENVLRGIEILQSTVNVLQGKGLCLTSDMEAALRALQRVAEIALRTGMEQAALCVLDAVTLATEGTSGALHSSGRILCDIGMLGLDGGRFLVAVACLNRLEALVLREQPVSATRATHYLGLAAHFWTSEMELLRYRAQLGLVNMAFDPSLQACVVAARQHYWALARPDTADRLDALLEDTCSP